MKALENLSKSKVQDFLLYSIAIVFALIGIYHGALGFYSIMDTPFMAWAFMGAIGICMFLMDIKLKSELENARRTSAILRITTVYFFVACVNMLGNFNTFFTKPIKEELIAKEREALKTGLTGLASFANAKIEEHTDMQRFTQKVNNELGNLKNEITDPKNQGIGNESIAILNRLSELFDGTPIQPPTSGRLGTPADALKVYEELEALILERMNRKIEGLETSTMAIESGRLIEKANSAKAMLDEAVKSPEIKDDESAMKEAQIAYNELLGFLKARMDNTGSFSKWTLSTESIGKYFYAIKIAMSGEYNEAAWIAFLQALFIDFIVPVIFLMVIGGKHEEQLIVQIEKLKAELAAEKTHINSLLSKIEMLKKQLAAIRQGLPS